MALGDDEGADSRDKHYDAPSTFTPESLLREARRQKGILDTAVPEVCILDPDGDIVRHLRATGPRSADRGLACYHSEMDSFEQSGREYGIVGCAVGASYAVLVAEQMFASGCRLLLSITSSGQITALRGPPYFILIERALRDEGTSYHYLPPSAFADADAAANRDGGRRTVRHRTNQWSAARPGRLMRHTGRPHRHRVRARSGHPGCRDGSRSALRVR